MTTLTFATAAAVSAPARAVGAFFANFFDGIREGLAIMKSYDQLSRLTDQELRRHGLNRQTIAQAAARGVEIH
jgi:hypothetical protein